MITVDEAIAVLNRALEHDREAVSAVLLNRVPCNEALADDPTVQVSITDGGSSTLSALGLLNGLFGVDEKVSRDQYILPRVRPGCARRRGRVLPGLRAGRRRDWGR